MKQFLSQSGKKNNKQVNKKNTKKNKVKEKRGLKKTLISLIVILLFGLLSVVTYYFINMGKVSNDKTLKEITINEGSIDSVARTLKSNNLIRNITIFKVYIKITGKNNLKAGKYILSENMGTRKIISLLADGSKINPDEILLTFKEGNNSRKFAIVVSEKTNNSYNDVINVMTDNEYIDTLINKVLDETNNKLSKYKDEINSSKYNIHEIMTLASIVELEGANANDRKAVAGVFVNRLNSNYYPTLGSDATTYYASKIDDWSYSLTYKELNDCSNKYNTRCSLNTGLPIGPICNPSIDSIEAVLNPTKHNYYYFVADCHGNVYLSENETVHINTINKLKKDNNWCA